MPIEWASEAFQFYQQAAEKGNISSTYQMGECYYYGRGVGKDFKKAIEWYEKAAEIGSGSACIDLAYIYLEGENGVAVDNKKAVKWLKKGIDNGNIRCKAMLGGCYMKGIGVGIDKNKACQLSQDAAYHGDKLGEYNFAVCLFNGWGIEEDLTRCMFFAQKSAKQGYDLAAYLVALLYDEFADPRDPEKAKEWYAKAAEYGNEEAKRVLAHWGTTIHVERDREILRRQGIIIK